MNVYIPRVPAGPSSNFSPHSHTECSPSAVNCICGSVGYCSKIRPNMGVSHWENCFRFIWFNGIENANKGDEDAILQLAFYIYHFSPSLIPILKHVINVIHWNRWMFKLLLCWWNFIITTQVETLWNVWNRMWWCVTHTNSTFNWKCWSWEIVFFWKYLFFIWCQQLI